MRQYYGGQVRDEVLSDVIRSTYSQAIADQKLNPAGGPRIEAVPGETPADQEHFTYRATFEVYPEIALQPLEQLALEVPRVAIEDPDVDAMIEKLRTQRATRRAVERPAVAGDRAVVDFEGKIDGELFAGGSGKDVGIVLGSGQVLAEFDRALHGASAGETKTAEVTFPANYPTTDLAGKKADFTITVQRVEEQVLPDIDDAFAASFGVTSGKVEDLAAEVRKNMERELGERLSRETKARVFDALIKANSISVPRALVEQDIETLQQGAMRELGVNDPDSAPAAGALRVARAAARDGRAADSRARAPKQDPARRRARRAAGARACGAVREARGGGAVLPRGPWHDESDRDRRSRGSGGRLPARAREGERSAVDLQAIHGRLSSSSAGKGAKRGRTSVESGADGRRADRARRAGL